MIALLARKRIGVLMSHLGIATKEEYEAWRNRSRAERVCTCFPWAKDADLVCCAGAMATAECDMHPMFSKCLCEVFTKAEGKEWSWYCRFHAQGTVIDGPHCVPSPTLEQRKKIGLQF